MEKSVVNLGAAGFDSVLYLQEGGSPLLAETAPGAPASYLEFLPATNDMSLVSPSEIVLEEPSEQGVGSVFWDKIGSRGPRPTDLYEAETSPMEAVEATMAGGEAGSFDEFVSKFGASPMPNQNTRGGARGSRSKDGNMETVMAQLNQIMGRGKKIAGEAWDSMNALQKASLVTTPLPIVPDVLGAAGDLQMYAQDPESRTPLNYGLSALGLLPFFGALTAYHGSPYVFDKFDINKIGTGEGAQAYGHGLYFSEHPDVAKGYREKLSNKVTVDGEKLRTHPSDGPMAEAQNNVVTAMIQQKMSPQEAIAHTVKYWNDAADEMAAFLKTNPELADRINEEVASRREVAKAASLLKPESFYKDPGALYTVDIRDEAIERMLDWNKPLSQQPDSVRNALKGSSNINAERIKQRINEGTSSDGFSLIEENGKYLAIADNNMFYEAKDFVDKKSATEWLGEKINRYAGGDPSGAQIYRSLVREFGEDTIGQVQASNKLKELGIPGIKYLDEGSRGAGDGTRNFVVFDDSIIEILEREE